ncbi:unnamed protein product [Brachionus calyciflorus]|uniref:Uncharacterized protein n=1 Tax=Brachionus calyciflorus TaxID=104777 RepID=A0A813MI79_9BILA|nr:unnamed protein product [Brachionus calyciflorus]
MKFKTNESSNSPGPSSSCQIQTSNNNDEQLSAFTNTILTRSAARLQNLSILPTSSNNKRNSSHSIGKIVKPIPVRAVSSSSSTHSSSFTSSNHHHNHPSSQASSSLLNLIKKETNDLKNSPNDSNFSLIAKYFASFPATRLKSTNNFDSNSQSESPIFENVKNTPFLPFKKFNSISSTSCTGSVSHNNNEFLIPNTSSNTDHLCTNFKRMIKLNNDDECLFSPASPLTARSSNTPNSLFNEQDLDYSNDSDQLDNRFSQIQMETRSTRKFLIKHHPYLRYNNSLLNNNNPTSPSSQSRPSINLLKMKKLKREDSPLLCDSSQNISKKKCKLSKKNSKKSDLIEEEVDFYGEDSADAFECNEIQEEMNSSLLNNSKDLDDCKEEDSSGYYSSYHSVDLVSSGGSCIGDVSLVKRHSDKTSQNVNKLDLGEGSVQKQEQPHHHYQTRYFTNYLQNQQKLTSPKPVTRLRYQQQLMANNSSSTNNQSCDLDLDQIEND